MKKENQPSSTAWHDGQQVTYKQDPRSNNMVWMDDQDRWVNIKTPNNVQVPGRRWVLDLTLGEEGSLGGLFDALPFSETGTEGILYGAAQRVERVLGAALLGPKNVAGLPETFENSRLAARFPENGIGADRTRKIMNSNSMFSVGSMLREGHLNGMADYIQESGLEKIIWIITQSGISSKDQIIALVGVIEAYLKSRHSNVEDVSHTFGAVLRMLDNLLASLPTSEKVLVLFDSTIIDEFNRLITAFASQTTSFDQIELFPHSPPSPNGKKTKWVQMKVAECVARRTKERLELFERNQPFSELDPSQLDK